MTLSNKKKYILRQLEEFRDRVYSASYRGNPKDTFSSYMFDDESIENQLKSADDELPFFLVMKAIQELINDDSLENRCEWIPLFLTRVERAVRGMPEKFESSRQHDEEDDDSFLKEYFVTSWKLYIDESQYILMDWKYHTADDEKDILIRYERVKEYEDQLNQRKFHQRKTFFELCNQHHSSLIEYLVNCIRFHCSIPVYSGNDGNLTTVLVPLRSFALGFVEKLLSDITNKLDGNVIPFIPSQEKNLNSNYDRDYCGRVNLHKVLKRCRWILILGDPGCSKTTLLRWIMLQLTRLIVERIQSFNDVKEQLDSWQRLAIGFNAAKMFDPGFRMRLPILIRISELVSWLYLHPNSTIMDYIGSQTWFSTSYIQNKDGSFLREFIYHGHAFLLFDGLDEVSNYNERIMIIKLIEEFVEKYVRTPSHISINDQVDIIDEWGNMNCELPKRAGGNQIILTSRIIGYSIYPIKLSMLKMFILAPMTKEESQAFIDHWFLHVPKSFYHNQSKKIAMKNNRTSRKNKESEIRQLLVQFNKNMLSHTMLLSLILPILYLHEKTTNIDQIQGRIQLFELAIQSILNVFIIQCEPSLDKQIVYYLLSNMAVYMHLYSPSGLMDTFDLTNLLYVSLTELYERKQIEKKQRIFEKICSELCFHANKSFKWIRYCSWS